MKLESRWLRVRVGMLGGTLGIEPAGCWLVPPAQSLLVLSRLAIPSRLHHNHYFHLAVHTTPLICHCTSRKHMLYCNCRFDAGDLSYCDAEAEEISNMLVGGGGAAGARGG